MSNKSINMNTASKLIIKLLIVVKLLKRGECTIGGLTYMDRMSVRPVPNEPAPGQDPCNPLYCYPKTIPDYCSYKYPQKPPTIAPQPMPPPAPSQMYIPPIYQPMMFPAPIYPPPIPLPYGVPLAPTHPMIPVPGIPYPGYRRPIGMVPGLSGLVTREGGINILPFTDAYSDLLEKHKQKMIRKRLEKVLDEYDGFPYKKHRPHADCRRYEIE